MTPPNPLVEFVQQLYAAFGRGDIPTILAALRPDTDWHVNVDLAAPGAADHALFRPARGPQEVGAFFTSLMQTTEIHSFQPVALMGSGREVAARILIDYTARSTGRRVKMEGMHHFTFDERGQVVRFVDFLDTLGEAHAFGLIRAAS